MSLTYTSLIKSIRLLFLFLADQSIKDRSTQYDKEMELRCRDLLENKVSKKNYFII